MSKFKPGDYVRNRNPDSVYASRIRGKVGVYQRPRDSRYTLHAECDVVYPGVTDLYGRPELAQSEDDLEKVPVEQPSTCDPFTAIIQDRRMRVISEWRSCGRRQYDAHGWRCFRCYPLSGPCTRAHGPYFYGYYQQGGKQKRVYLGRTLPNAEKIQ